MRTICIWEAHGKPEVCATCACAGRPIKPVIKSVRKVELEDARDDNRALTLDLARQGAAGRGEAVPVAVWFGMAGKNSLIGKGERNGNN